MKVTTWQLRTSKPKADFNNFNMQCIINDDLLLLYIERHSFSILYFIFIKSKRKRILKKIWKWIKFHKINERNQVKIKTERKIIFR